MSVLLLVMTDGRRNCIEQTIPAALRNLNGEITRKIIHDDSGDSYYQAWLAQTFPDFEIIRTPTRAGFGGAIESAWMYLRLTAESDDCRFLFTLEDDFVLEREVPLDRMSRLLDRQPHLAQLVLKRQPWNPDEQAAGGIIEQHPDDYTDCYEGTDQWVEHRRFFSTNPNLARRSICWRGWPVVDHSEGVFTHQLLEDPDLRFAFWGTKADHPWVTHIGTERVGNGY
jgi:hypothetical protein